MSTLPSPIAITTPNVTNTTSVQVVAANPSRTGLVIFNPNASNDLWVAPTGTTAAVNGAGSFKIAALTTQVFGPPNQPVWTNGINAIASAGGTNVITIFEFTD
jgi:hypothetical protein